VQIVGAMDCFVTIMNFDKCFKMQTSDQKNLASPKERRGGSRRLYVKLIFYWVVCDLRERSLLVLVYEFMIMIKRINVM